MDKYKRYYGLIAFVVAFALLCGGIYFLIMPKADEVKQLDSELQGLTSKLQQKKSARDTVIRKKKKLKDSLFNSQKKIYSPVDTGLENDTLFFTLYNDVIEMLHSNSVKIKTMDYTYNPASDAFVQFGKDVYFVCDINMELVSNYINLGKLIQDIYQYPYYIRINELEVRPYSKDKKILLSTLNLRLYAHTMPQDEVSVTKEIDKKLKNAELPLQ
jgi:Tfp pilus assembly protein PilO